MAYHFGIDPRRYAQKNEDEEQPKPVEPVYNPYLLTTASPIDPRKNSPKIETSRSLTPRSSRPRPFTALDRSSSQKISTPLTLTERNHEFFDLMIQNLNEKPLYLALEEALQCILNCTSCYVYKNFPKIQSLISQTRNKTCSYDASLIGKCYNQGRILCYSVPSKQAEFNPDFDFARDFSMYIPIQRKDQQIIAIAQCIRRPNRAPFGPDDEMSAQFFIKKFRTYSPFILPSDSIKAVGSIISCSSTANSLVHQLTATLQNLFGCLSIEFYKYSENLLYKFEGLSWVPIDQLPNSVSIDKRIVEPITKCFSMNFVNDPLLIVPTRISQDGIFAIAIHGSENRKSFSDYDEIRLTSFISLVGRSFTNLDSPHLQALLDIAGSLSRILDVDSLIKICMDRASTLLDTERCSLFLIDHKKHELVLKFQKGLDHTLCVPLTRGIVGYTATTGKVINIKDAYQDDRFDKSIDLETGYKTKTVLTVPIFSHVGEVLGVTEVINTKDGRAFDENDVNLLAAFNVFCGISLENATLYQTSIGLTQQLKGIMETSSAMKSSEIRDVVSEILENSMTIIHSANAYIYVRNFDDSLKAFVGKGDDIIPSSVLLQYAVSTKNAMKTSIYKYDFDDPSSKSKNIVSLPLKTNDRKVLGILEYVCDENISQEDIQLLECFAVFTTLAIQKTQLEELARFGPVGTKLKMLIAENEKSSFEVPEKLRLTEGEQKSVLSINFNAPSFDNIGFLRVLFFIFSKFNLLQEFSISNEKFFRFCSEMSGTYKKVPYHNWRHAVDVTQFVFYEISTGKLENKLPKFDIFALLVSAICHDANHDGFTNVYNEKAETPLGILFKNQSVMETHHCSTTIRIISQEECNIFSALSKTDYKLIWTEIIKLILATDMAKHHDFIQSSEAIFDSFDFSNRDHRILLCQLLLKTADISNVSRPFELADNWCDVLCEEFFRQGDLEKTGGMEYTSPLNDREHLNKPKSQIGFYNFVCLPLYQIVAKMVPDLQCNVDYVLSNLAIWKEKMK